MTAILALDLGTKTGWAVARNGVLLQSGTREIKPSRYSGGGMRYLQFRGWLQDLLNLTAFDRVYFEEVRRHRSTDSAHVYGGFLATLTSWCEEHKIPYEGLPVQTIKKWATGKGNANKEAVIAAMVKHWQRQVQDDNEADALAILGCALTYEPAPRRRIFSA